MEEITFFGNNIWALTIIRSAIIIVISIVLYRGISYLLRKGEKKDKLKLFTNKKSKTYLKLIRSIIRYIFIAITILIILQVNGIDVSSVLAGVGILGAVFGLAIQDWLKDIIRGSSILSDNYFSVGDVVKYKDTEGKVLVIGLKTTKIQDLVTSNIISIANRNIEEIELVSNLIYVRIPMPYEVSVGDAEKAISDIIKRVEESNLIESCRYLGVTELADSNIQYLLEAKMNPETKLQAKRDTLRAILIGLADNNIQVPYNQIDIHNK